ncbi:MAG TPA: PQQ-dependent sugar dehydrogenase [Gemmatimonadaceae bacterium]|nr:PQQ-dependent sugar dehydrogenase [Gemmatimonadaceae bacterium]
MRTPRARRWRARTIVGLVSLSVAACTVREDAVQRSQLHRYRIVHVVEGLDYAWGMAFLPNGDMLVTERDGALRIIRDGVLDTQHVSGVPAVRATGQGGLLDVAIHPNFATNKLVYLSFSKPGPEGATTAVVRGRLEGHALVDVQDVFEAKAWTRGAGHFGSRLAFDRNGYLFISVGERQIMRDAQRLDTHQGKIIRLHDDGRVPKDNPFVGRKDTLPEIYALGIRNPQGLTIHPTTGEVWESEHGPRGGDEINVIRAGRNYGWPVITHGIGYDGIPISEFKEMDGMETPLFAFVPSIGTSGIAIYHGDAFPEWRGDVFVGGLVGEELARVSFKGNEPKHEALVRIGRRIRDVRVGADGFIYLLIDEANAPMLRLEPAR